jgi:hypothetical protein
MPMELDHVFICASAGAEPEASALVAFGLAEGKANTHPGQGTACRRFFFQNAYLELLWVENPAEAQSKMIQPTHLWERWTGPPHNTCPFGLGFRPGALDNSAIPFPAWEYRPPYLPDTWTIQVATNAAELAEPMLFYLPFARKPDAVPTEHPAALRKITRLDFFSPLGAKQSAALKAVSKIDVFRVRPGPKFLLDLGFDGELHRQLVDFRPLLPVIFRW